MNENYENIDRGTKSFPFSIFTQTYYLEESHHHFEYEIFFLTEGPAIFGVDGHEYQINVGTVVFINPGVNHFARKIPGNPFSYYAIVFDESIIGNQGDVCRDFLDRIRVNRFINLSSEILDKIPSVCDVYQNNGVGKEIKSKSLLFSIINHVIETQQYETVSLITKQKRSRVSAIESALIYIHSHYKETINLSDILKITNYSKSQFIRLFKENTGFNVTDYINKYRIGKACLDLVYTEKNITEIASENGFNNIQYFSRTFKEYMNCTPKQYQKKGLELTAPPPDAKLVY